MSSEMNDFRPTGENIRDQDAFDHSFGKMKIVKRSIGINQLGEK